MTLLSSARIHTHVFLTAWSELQGRCFRTLLHTACFFRIFGNDTIVICPDTYTCVPNCMIQIARPMFPDPAAYSVLLQFTLGLCPICRAHVWCHMSSWIIIWVIIRSVIDYGFIIYTLYSSNIVHLTWHRLQNLCHAKAWMHDYPKHPAIRYLTQPQSQSKLVL